jgi:ketosteroid isomerase-like protein
MRPMLIPTVLAAISFSSFALGRMTSSEQQRAKAPKSDIELRLKDLDRQWLEASSNADTDFLKGLFADSMFEVQPNGHVVTGAEMLQSITKKGKDEGTVDDIEVRGIYGDTAVLTDRRTIKTGVRARGRGYPDGPYRVMRVYVKLHEKWLAVGAAMAPLIAQ